MPHWVLMPFVDTWDLTRAAADDVLAQTLPDTRLLLIDNGSADPARRACQDYVVAHTGRVSSWHWTPPFPSLSACWNRALRFVWATGATHAWVVNNDVRLHPDTYATLLEVLDHTDGWFVSAVSVREEQFDSTINLRAGLGTVTESRKDGVRPEGYSYGGPDFSCYVITQACHDKYPFDENFIPAYHEDCDLHRRLMLGGDGHRIFGVNVPFLHYGSATINRTPEIRAAFGPRFEACKQYYIDKWGGAVNEERYRVPHDPTSAETGITNPELQHGQAARPA